MKSESTVVQSNINIHTYHRLNTTIIEGSILTIYYCLFSTVITSGNISTNILTKIITARTNLIQ